jgi:hypothetical protein
MAAEPKPTLQLSPRGPTARSIQAQFCCVCSRSSCLGCLLCYVLGRQFGFQAFLVINLCYYSLRRMAKVLQLTDVQIYSKCAQARCVPVFCRILRAAAETPHGCDLETSRASVPLWANWAFLRRSEQPLWLTCGLLSNVYRPLTHSDETTTSQ